MNSHPTLSEIRRQYRHPLPTRLVHWVNALAFVVLFMSGLQIFNAHPRLYWGNDGFLDTPAVFEIAATSEGTRSRGWLIFGDFRMETTGFLGELRYIPGYETAPVAFPSYMTLPSGVLELGKGRGWHFLALWIFAFNLLAYYAYGIASGRFRRTLLPIHTQLRWRTIRRELWQHLLCRRAVGEAATRYNLLQQISYIVVLFVLLPTMILSGMTMSPSMLARFPWLIDLFDGRQSARTIHFFIAWALLAFLLIHVFQVFVNGVVNELRSMITGWFRVEESK